MKHIAILGSTGSIGQNALRVAEKFPDKFSVTALSTNSNINILYKQIKLFRPEFACVVNKDAALKLKSRLKSGEVKLFAGEEGLIQLAQEKNIEEVLLAITGSGALKPLLKAIDSGKDVALANKEALVMAGSIIMNKAKEKKIKIIPIDSEQSAIWQCLDGQDRTKLKQIYLTASGGPFRQIVKEKLKDITVKEVLRHPRWRMGKKITVDSASLMNKGLEVLEAIFLFNLSADKIKVIIHPEVIIHSMVEFIDGIILAQLSATDMRIPIQYALSYPERFLNGLPALDFYKLKELNFQKVDFKKFPCLELAYRAAGELGTMPAVLNAADEVCVDEFLKNRLSFISMPKVIEKVLGRHKNKKEPGLDEILDADNWAREEAYKAINEKSHYRAKH